MAEKQLTNPTQQASEMSAPRSINIALIYGSTREGRFCDTVGRWAAAEISRDRNLVLDVIDPATLRLPDRHKQEETAEIAALKERIGRADAFIIITPEYNHSYPAALKFVIDSVHTQWQAKPVAFISYGGVSGGLRAVEHLRGIFAELHAVTIRDSISFPHVWSRFDSEGKMREADRAAKNMDTLLRQLTWWAVALADARRAMPYGEAA
ncbi:MAG TPA: NAD(P)H-dependent oxidoreductase [Bryobacteraceae bacterium]|nr:NAD(P)H-dependent oxidoreductase [Bryobacteraceae bacterium]